MDIIHCHNQEEVTYYLNKYNLPWNSGNEGYTSAEYEIKNYYANHPENFHLCFRDRVTYTNHPSLYQNSNIIEGKLPSDKYHLYDLGDNLITITYLDNINTYLPCIIYHNGDKLEVTSENVEEIKKILE